MKTAMTHRIPEQVVDELHESVENMERLVQEMTLPAATIPFNEYDDAMMHDILGNDRLAKPVQALLEMLHTIKATSGSFGMDKAKAFDYLLPQLEALREACEDEWRDQ